MTKQAMILTRGIGAIAATAVLVTGISFAALNSNSVTLTGNQFAVNSAVLQISSTGTDDFGTTANGFNVGTLDPGQTTTPVDFFLKNTGSDPLTITAQASNFIENNGSFDATQATITVNRIDGGGSGSGSATLQELNDTAQTLPGGAIAPSSTAEYSATLTLSPTFSGSGGQTVQFDTTFTGTGPTS